MLIAIALALPALLQSVPRSELPEGPDSGARPPAWFELVADGFPPRPADRQGRSAGQAFDVVTADLDHDGDLDVVANWHHFGQLELYRNEGTAFVLVEHAESGLFENPGLPSVFAKPAEMRADRDPGEAPGLYVWHDPRRDRSWRFRWRATGPAPLELVVETSLRVDAVTGLDEEEWFQPAERRVIIRPSPARGALREWSLDVHRVATQLRLRAGVGDEPAPLFVGPARLAVEGGELELWNGDPHGMAWVDVAGPPTPDLFVTRGGIGGSLAPPADGKRDQLFVASTGATHFERMPPERVPRSFGRGRRVEAVDVGGDGTLEIFVGNRASANELFTLDPQTGALSDVAPAMGLAAAGAEVGAWADFDGDGRDDYYHLAGDSIDVARWTPDGFETLAGRELGLALPRGLAPSDRGGQHSAAGRFDDLCLRVADFDSDGQLDLWLLGSGPAHGNRLFLRRGEGFEDVSEGTGFHATAEQRSFALLDVDADGFEDLVGFGSGAALWRNVAGARLDRHALASMATGTARERPERPERLGREVAPRSDEVRAVAALDADGDRRTDLALLTDRAWLLRNRGRKGASEADARVLRVVLARSVGGGTTHTRPGPGTRAVEPVGAVVTVHWTGGRAQARRYGSVQSSLYSQGLAPLDFGLPAGAAVERVTVRWPGSAVATEYEAPTSTANELVLRRKP